MLRLSLEKKQKSPPIIASTTTQADIDELQAQITQLRESAEIAVVEDCDDKAIV